MSARVGGSEVGASEGGGPGGDHPAGASSAAASASAAAPDVDDAPPVRPYAVTGGRRTPTSTELPLEAMVRANGAPAPGMTGEERTALALAADRWQSVAELSAHLRLPVPVVRVVVDGLVRAGALRLQATAPARSAPSRQVLLSVLEGIRDL